MGREGHPLPASDESRHGEIPEDKIEEKGFGDDSAERVQPPADPVSPDGEAYRYDDNGRAENIETGQGGGAENVETGEGGGAENVETGEGGDAETLGPGTPA